MEKGVEAIEDSTRRLQAGLNKCIGKVKKSKRDLGKAKREMAEEEPWASM